MFSTWAGLGYHCSSLRLVLLLFEGSQTCICLDLSSFVTLLQFYIFGLFLFRSIGRWYLLGAFLVLTPTSASSYSVGLGTGLDSWVGELREHSRDFWWAPIALDSSQSPSYWWPSFISRHWPCMVVLGICIGTLSFDLLLWLLIYVYDMSLCLL